MQNPHLPVGIRRAGGLCTSIAHVMVRAPTAHRVLQWLLNANDSQRGYSEDARARADESNLGRAE